MTMLREAPELELDLINKTLVSQKGGAYFSCNFGNYEYELYEDTYENSVQVVFTLDNKITVANSILESVKFEPEEKSIIIDNVEWDEFGDVGIKIFDSDLNKVETKLLQDTIYYALLENDEQLSGRIKVYYYLNLEDTEYIITGIKKA